MKPSDKDDQAKERVQSALSSFSRYSNSRLCCVGRIINLHIQRKRETNPGANKLSGPSSKGVPRLTGQPAGQCIISPLWLEIIPQAQVLVGALEKPLWFFSSYMPISTAAGMDGFETITRTLARYSSGILGMGCGRYFFLPAFRPAQTYSRPSHPFFLPKETPSTVPEVSSVFY